MVHELGTIFLWTTDRWGEHGSDYEGDDMSSTGGH